MRLLPVALILVLALAACGDPEPADFHGTYTLSLTNGENGCAFPNYTVGETGAATMDVTQTGTAATAEVTGWAAVILNAWLGDATFTGSIDESTANLVLHGTRSTTSGSCTYTIDGYTVMHLTGDTVNGTITYRPRTNAAADCGVLQSCSTIQQLAGSRPPQ